MPLPFTPNLEPLPFQADYLEEHGLDTAWALFWATGTGKSLALVLSLVKLLLAQKTDAALVLAPNGPHRNFAIEEVPKHWPKDAPSRWVFIWDTNKAANRSFQQELENFMYATLPGKGLVGILVMSFDAFMTEPAKKATWNFLRTRRVFYALDESQRIKTPDAKRTKRVLASGQYASHRRIASGTPADSPFDFYSQVRFVDPLFWQRTMGISTFAAFKAHFGIWEQRTISGGASFPQLLDYRNLEELAAALKTISSRVVKEDVLDLLPKAYKRVFHELTLAQRHAYQELKQEALTVLDSGEMVTAEMALVLQLRLSQIGCGFVTPAAGMDPVPFTRNPRGEMLREILTDLTRPSIIWHQFRLDAVTAAEASRAAGRRPVVFDGNDPDAAIEEFRSGRADDIIANLNSGMREGYTLNEADTAIYYSRSSKLLHRTQSEDRNWRMGQTRGVTYIDLLAEGTLDAKVLQLLMKKNETSGFILGDDPAILRAWLREALTDGLPEGV